MLVACAGCRSLALTACGFQHLQNLPILGQQLRLVHLGLPMIPIGHYTSVERGWHQSNSRHTCQQVHDYSNALVAETLLGAALLVTHHHGLVSAVHC